MAIQSSILKICFFLQLPSVAAFILGKQLQMHHELNIHHEKKGAKTWSRTAICGLRIYLK